MKTIFLDFDGVLFDTVLESYLLARYAFYNIAPQDKINHDEYNLFHSVRYLITNSWNYYYIMKLINDDINIEKFQKTYQKAICSRDVEADSVFDKKFQEERKDLINNHFEFWNNLDKPYPFFDKIKSIANDYNIIIVSTKNEEAIVRHCNDYDLAINKENIIGKAKLKKYGTKKTFLEYYINKNQIKKSIFVDDNKSTIDSCRTIPYLQTFVANWGYVANKNDGLNEEEILSFIKEF